MRVFNTIGILLATMLATMTALIEPKDHALVDGLMSVSFGGQKGTDPTSPEKCCIKIEECTGVPVGCSSYNSEVACEAGVQVVLQEDYAKKCQYPTIPNPKASCSEYEKDLTGRVYYCVARFNCYWDYEFGVGVCKRGAARNDSVPGYFSCASNCP